MFHCIASAEARKLEWLKKMIVAALILVLSLAALIQFAAFAWRAAFLSEATAELPADTDKSIEMSGFEEASAYGRLCPELEGGGLRLGTVNLYRTSLQIVTSLGESIMPSAAVWAQREMVLCTRYATVTLAQRIERNHRVAAELSSY